MNLQFKQDKGVAGLTILLSLVVMLFVLGLLVMIFAIMSGKLADTDTLYGRSGSTTVGLETVALTTAGTNVAGASYRDPICTLVAVYNDTTKLANGNVTEISECKFKNNTYYSTWKLNYTYTYLQDQSGAVGVINDTTSSVSSVTDWFDIFIVIGAMVVLILLTVIIIVSIRSSGLVAGAGTSTGANTVGTA